MGRGEFVVLGLFPLQKYLYTQVITFIYIAPKLNDSQLKALYIVR